jgi:CIC family chloride channel protein
MAEQPSSFWARLKFSATGRLMLLSVIVGVVAGLGAWVFNLCLNWSDWLFMQKAAGYVMPQPAAEGTGQPTAAPTRRWVLLVVPAVGGLLAGWLVYSFAPEAEGHGTDAMIEAFHRKRGLLRKRVPFIKTVASALTIGSGGSAGREGPIAQIGGGFGSVLATWLKAGDRERRLLLLAGAGAGIGAVFRAPLGGALFGVEVLYREVEFEGAALVPSFIASIVAYSIYCAANGTWGPIFALQRHEFSHPMELPLYALLGLICAAVGTIYVKVFYGVRDRLFRPLRIPRHLKPALGGVAVGIIGFFLPETLGMGYGWLQKAIDGQLAVTLMLTIALAKIVATALTIGSGGSGGVFAPSITIGGLTGATTGAILHRFFPELVPQCAPFALVGMAGFFAGVSKAPIASLIMVSEMAAGYGLLAPLMLTTAIAYLVTPRRVSIYENQCDRRIDSPAHEGEYVVDVLERIRVRDAIRKDQPLTTFCPDSPLPEILDGVAASKQHAFPVLQDGQRLVGVIYFDDIRVFFTERGLPARAVVAQDLLATSSETLTPDEDLASALRKFRTAARPELPVVDGERVVGVLSRTDVMAVYQDQMQRPR